MDDILNKLQWGFSTPEAKHFQALLKNKKEDEAKIMLEPYLTDDEIQTIIIYFNQQIFSKVSLIELATTEIDLTDFSQSYLVLYASEFHKTTLDFYREKFIFWIRDEHMPYIEIQKAVQIWKIN